MSIRGTRRLIRPLWRLAVTLVVSGVMLLGSGTSGATLTPRALAAATSLAPMPQPRGLPGVVTIGNEIYVIGGTQENTNLQTVDVYNTATDTWGSKPPMQVGHGVAGAAIGADGRIYVAGGNLYSGVVEAYDLATSTWQMLAAPLTPNRINATAVADAQGRIFLFGGYTSCCEDISTRVEMLDVTTGTWTVRRPMPFRRTSISAVRGPDGAIYVVGGEDAVSPPSAEMDRYDPMTDTWTSRAPMLTRRLGPGLAFGPNGHLYAAGGFDAGHAVVALEEYSIDTDSWVARQPLPEGRISHRLAAVGGKLYTIGGTRFELGPPLHNTPSTTVMAYDIATDSWIPDRALPIISSLKINQGAYYTNSLQVTLSIDASDIGEGLESMSFSNDGVHWSDWQPYASTVEWTMAQRSDTWNSVMARVKDRAGNVSDPPNQAIIGMDQVPPTAVITILASPSASNLHAASPTRQVQLSATDNISPVNKLQMRLSNRADFAGAIWRPYSTAVTWDFTGGLCIYAQFKDEAGNISQTYSQSLPGLPPSGSGPNPICSPRPRIAINTEPAIGVPEGGGALNVTVSTTGSNNGLRAVRFDSFVNAKVHVGSQQNQTTPFAVSIPAGQEPTSLQFTLQRLTNGQPTTVRMSVIDGCGEWSTLVGGGPRAF